MTEKNKINIMAISSLIIGIFSILLTSVGIILGLIGIVLSIIAKKQIDNTKENGKSYAKAGFICSIIGVSIQLFLIVEGIRNVFY